MTYTPVEDFTPAQRVGTALYRCVVDSFEAGMTDADRSWLTQNKAKAAKLFRFHNAMAWFWADLFVQRGEITEPNPQEFMPFFREAAFSYALSFFPGMAERDGGKLLWALICDDDEKTPALIEGIIAEKPPYLMYAIGKAWLEKEDIDIGGPQNALWMRSITVAGEMNERVRVALGLN